MKQLICLHALPSPQRDLVPRLLQTLFTGTSFTKQNKTLPPSSPFLLWIAPNIFFKKRLKFGKTKAKYQGTYSKCINPKGTSEVIQATHSPSAPCFSRRKVGTREVKGLDLVALLVSSSGSTKTFNTQFPFWYYVTHRHSKHDIVSLYHFLFICLFIHCEV